MFNWCGVVGTSSPFFCRADAAFNIRHVLVFAADAQFGPEVSSDCAASAFKFTVAENVGDAESAFSVDTVDASQRFDERAKFAVVKDFGGNETDVLGDGEEEWNAVDKHDVNAEGNVTILCHDLHGHVRYVSSDASKRLSRCLPFE